MKQSLCKLPVMKFQPFKIPSKKIKKISNSTNNHQYRQIQSAVNSVDNQKYYCKNAFRYIARIALRQGSSKDYRPKIIQICDKNGCSLDSLLGVFSQAQSVSGPRYFEGLLNKLHEEQKQQRKKDNHKKQKCVDCKLGLVKSIKQYMLWFLRFRYIRYMDRKTEVKRKLIKKQQYLKYKNYVMIPMLIKMEQGESLQSQNSDIKSSLEKYQEKSQQKFY